MAKKPKEKLPGNDVVARNRRARHDYAIESTIEAGIELTGTEVKTLRARLASIEQAWARIDLGEVWLVDVNIPEYAAGTVFNHAPKRKRKLLLHRSEIRKIEGILQDGGKTLVPLELYFTPRGYAKVLLAIGAGRKEHDKRQVLAKKAADREIARAVRRTS